MGATNGRGYTYQDYESLPPDAYLTLTGQWAARFLETTWPETTRLRVRVVSTSDWTNVDLLSGATWLRPSLVSTSDEATDAGLRDGRFTLSQPIYRAEAGGEVEIVADVLVSGWESGGTLVFEIERGHLGWTQVELLQLVEGEPVLVETFAWGGITSGERNAATFPISADVLFGPEP